MKKITFIILLFCVSFAVNAQLTEDFETDPLAGWTFMQTEADDPGFVQTGLEAHGGAASFYHNDDNIVAESTSWMIAPAHAVVSGESLSFWYYQRYTVDYHIEGGVWISTASADPIANPNDFTEIIDFGSTSDGAWSEFSFDLEDYDGQTVYVAFKYRGDYADELYIDDFSILGCQAPSAALIIVEDCDNDQFTIEIDVVSLGDSAIVTISNNAGVGSIDVGGTGFISIGPFAKGTNVEVTLEHQSDAGCNTVFSDLVDSCPLPEPECTTNPVPADITLDIDPGLITFSWTAPTSEPVPTSYEFYAGTDIANLALITTVTVTTVDINVNGFGTLFYWRVVPINNLTPATGCADWSFTTVAEPNAPANDDIFNAMSINVDENYCNGTNTNGNNYSSTDSSQGAGQCFNAGADNDVWFTFVVPADTATVNISTDFTGGTNEDTEIALYSGDPGALVEIACSQDDGITDLSNGESWNSLITGQAVTANETYFVQVSGYGIDNRGTFCLAVDTAQTLGVENFDLLEFEFFPNPVNNILTVKAQNNIQNVAIYNMLGQEVLIANPERTECNVNMSSLQTGTYFVKVISNDTEVIIRIVKQ